MKLFFGEFPANYEKYHFPYQVWLLKEEGDLLDGIYNNGFLPMRNKPNLYYLSRSLRVDLNKFELSSENRRILGKTEGILASLIPLSEFDYNFEVQKFCKDYSDKKLGGVFSTQDIKSIFLDQVYNHVLVFKDTSSNQKVVGYAVCFIEGKFCQYAYAFYDLDYIKENLGARMMLEALLLGKKNEQDYVYLGTCYEEHALYKTEFKGIEFFNGFQWSDNLSELKELINTGRVSDDKERGEQYLLRNKDYLEKYYQGDLETILSKYGIRVSL